MQHSTQDARHCVEPDAGHGGGLLLVVLLGLALSIAAGLVSSRVMRRGVTDTSAASGAAVTPGATLEAVVQITSLDGKSVHARLLERRGQGYVPGTRTLRVILTPDTRYVMGGRSDLKPGAVLQLKGIVQDTAGRELQASQAVILTGYVQVTP